MRARKQRETLAKFPRWRLKIQFLKQQYVACDSFLSNICAIDDKIRKSSMLEPLSSYFEHVWTSFGLDMSVLQKDTLVASQTIFFCFYVFVDIQHAIPKVLTSHEESKTSMRKITFELYLLPFKLKLNFSFIVGVLRCFRNVDFRMCDKLCCSVISGI